MPNITIATQVADTTRGYHLTPLNPDESTSTIQGDVAWSTNRNDRMVITPSGPQNLHASIYLVPQSTPGLIDAYADGVNANGVSFRQTISVTVTAPPPPPPVADHFGVVQDPA